jgi:hypothetical protein
MKSNVNQSFLLEFNETKQYMDTSFWGKLHKDLKQEETLEGLP